MTFKLYTINDDLRLGESEFDNEAAMQIAKIALVAAKIDVFETKVQALTAIELCRDQHRKNQTKEA